MSTASIGSTINDIQIAQADRIIFGLEIVQQQRVNRTPAWCSRCVPALNSRAVLALHGEKLCRVHARQELLADG